MPRRRGPLPRVGAEEVLVRNRWIGVNRADLQHTAGTPYSTTVPFVPGTEAAGEVIAVGSQVRDLATGTPEVHFGHIGPGDAAANPPGRPRAEAVCGSIPTRPSQIAAPTNPATLERSWGGTATSCQPGFGGADSDAPR